MKEKVHNKPLPFYSSLTLTFFFLHSWVFVLHYDSMQARFFCSFSCIYSSISFIFYECKYILVRYAVMVFVVLDILIWARKCNNTNKRPLCWVSERCVVHELIWTSLQQYKMLFLLFFLFSVSSFSFLRIFSLSIFPFSFASCRFITRSRDIIFHDISINFLREYKYARIYVFCLCLTDLRKWMTMNLQ